MTRWKASVTWHEGMEGSSWAVEAFADGQRLSCVTAEVDEEDDVQRSFMTLARVMADRAHPPLL